MPVTLTYSQRFYTNPKLSIQQQSNYSYVLPTRWSLGGFWKKCLSPKLCGSGLCTEETSQMHEDACFDNLSQSKVDICLPNSNFWQHIGIFGWISTRQNDIRLFGAKNVIISLVLWHILKGTWWQVGYPLHVCRIHLLFNKKLKSGLWRGVCRRCTFHVLPELCESQLVCHIQFLLGGKHACQQLYLCKSGLCPVQVGHFGKERVLRWAITALKGFPSPFGFKDAFAMCQYFQVGN